MNDWVPLSHQAGDHALSLFAQRFDHLENIHQLLALSVVQHVPQGAENPRAGRAVTEEHKTPQVTNRNQFPDQFINLYISIYVLDSCEPVKDITRKRKSLKVDLLL